MRIQPIDMALALKNLIEHARMAYIEASSYRSSDLVALADQARYEVKENGRNQSIGKK